MLCEGLLSDANFQKKQKYSTNRSDQVNEYGGHYFSLMPYQAEESNGKNDIPIY